MCKCIREWTQDPEVTGDHSAIPIFCEDYIAQLEAELKELRGSDSPARLSTDD